MTNISNKERRRDIIFIKSCNVLTFAEQNKKNLPRFQKSLNIFRSKKEKSLKFTQRSEGANIHASFPASRISRRVALDEWTHNWSAQCRRVMTDRLNRWWRCVTDTVDCIYMYHCFYKNDGLWFCFVFSMWQVHSQWNKTVGIYIVNAFFGCFRCKEMFPSVCHMLSIFNL